MSMLPIISNFQGDFVLQLVAVDSENTMDQVAAAAAHHSVGRRVAPQPDKVIRVRRRDAQAFFPEDARIGDLGVQPMECLEFIFTDAA